jgi:hypothetical protein
MHHRATWPRSHRAAARRSGAAVVLCAVLVLMCGGRVDAARDLEYPVKAEFLERFTRFIKWPDTSFAEPDSPFVVCVVGENPFGGYHGRLLRQRRIQARRAELRLIPDPDHIDACHLVFIARDERRHIASILEHTSGKPILTVGDTPGFAQAGVLVNLYIESSNVRFEINVSAVKDSGLKFSSKLLKLARLVDQERLQ